MSEVALVVGDVEEMEEPEVTEFVTSGLDVVAPIVVVDATLEPPEFVVVVVPAELLVVVAVPVDPGA